MKVIAIIVAAGEGKRIGGERSKQFVEIAGKPILYYTLDRFESCNLIDEIVLVLPQKDLDYAAGEIVDRFGFRKIRRIVAGGRERQDSVYCGLKAITDTPEIVVIHDGVRPFVNSSKIEASIATCRRAGAVILAIPARCTIKEGKNGYVVKTIERDRLWEVQTPQTFKYEIILAAYQQAFSEGFYATDDSALVERLGYKVKILPGEGKNIKITSPEDLELAELLLRREEESADRVRI